MVKKYKIAIYLFILSFTCTPINIETTIKDEIHFPIFDRENKLHRYKNEINLKVYEERSAYCLEHTTWEDISMRYKGTSGDVQYIVTNRWWK